MGFHEIGDLQDFHQFVGDSLKGGIHWSPEEAVDEWRPSHPDAEVSAEDLAAIQQALMDLANGERGTSFEDFDRDFRKRHGLPGAP